MSLVNQSKNQKFFNAQTVIATLAAVTAYTDNVLMIMMLLRMMSTLNKCRKVIRSQFQKSSFVQIFSAIYSWDV